MYTQNRPSDASLFIVYVPLPDVDTPVGHLQQRNNLPRGNTNG